MRDEVAERSRAGPRFLESPDAREVRRHEPVLQVGPPVMVDLAELPLLDDLLSERHRRSTAVVVAEHVYDTVSLHGSEHRFGLSQSVSQRLLAKDDLLRG